MAEQLRAHDLTTKADGSPAETKGFPCSNPDCQVVFKSPYHTICPVCATPVDPKAIREALGNPDGEAGIDLLTKGLIAGAIAIVIIGVILILAL